MKNFYVCCGDRHWQYMSIDPKTGLREFSCGPASDVHAGGNPEQPDWQPFLRVEGGFLTVSVRKKIGAATIDFRHHDVPSAAVRRNQMKMLVLARQTSWLTPPGLAFAKVPTLL